MSTNEIMFKLSLDSNYIKKSKMSICKDCVHNNGWLKEFYDCEIYNIVSVEYKQEGVFHTEIIKCNKYEAINND